MSKTKPAADPRKNEQAPPPAPAKAKAPPLAPQPDPHLAAIAEPEKLARRKIDEDVLDDDMTPMLVDVPVAFMLHHPQGVHTHYAVGVQSMPACHANHTYAKAVGVKRAKKVKAEAED